MAATATVASAMTNRSAMSAPIASRMGAMDSAWCNSLRLRPDTAVHRAAATAFDLFSDLDFKLTVYDRYDSQPPPGNETNDTGLTLGLSWSY